MTVHFVSKVKDVLKKGFIYILAYKNNLKCRLFSMLRYTEEKEIQFNKQNSFFSAFNVKRKSQFTK